MKSNPSLQRYYSSLESRIGYKLFLGGTRHFGYYEAGTICPFPIDAGLRRMEEHLFHSLGLEAGTQVIDAGCGVGHVAIHMARKGLRIRAIDFMPKHADRAQKNIRASGFEKMIDVQLMDYHHLDSFSGASCDGVYTMETLVHATDPRQALREFFHVLKPGGRIAMYEYDHVAYKDPRFQYFTKLKLAADQINQNASMPSNTAFEEGVLEGLLKEEGFQDVVIQDLSENVKPLLRLFMIVAYIPYLIISLLGLKARFVNTQAAVEGWRILDNRLWRFTAVTARKPTEEALDENKLRERRPQKSDETR